jgi:light-regulated signal transduction histidine kinase (bacteriophytochrome)
MGIVIFFLKDNGIECQKKFIQKYLKLLSLLQQVNIQQVRPFNRKKIITFYNGEIWLESQEGVGTTFFVKLKKES